MKSITILYASEGTGHRAAAENLRDWFLFDNPDGRVLCRDVLEYIPTWLRHIISDGYLLMARHAPWAWGWFYWGSDKTSFQSAGFNWFHSLLCRLYLPKIERDICEIESEAVIFTHYFGASPFAKRNMKKYPVFYVNTDFICHRFQRDKLFRASFVASPIALDQHSDEGIDMVFDLGIPVSRTFSSLPSKKNARKSLGLDLERKVVLVSGGGIGAGSVASAVRSLANNSDLTTIVICGNNKKLFKTLSSLYRERRHVRILAFVTNMQDYYCAADLGIMKPGGLSLSEALAATLPLLLMDPIPGQEQLNMDYLCKLRAARCLEDKNNASEETMNFFNDKETLSEIRTNISKLSRPDAAFQILTKIGDFSA